jgi:hypothetical protein
MNNRADWEDVGKALQQYRELWLVIDPGDIGKSTRAVWKRIQEDSNFSLESEEQFGNLRMERYRKGAAAIIPKSRREIARAVTCGHDD